MCMTFYLVYLDITFFKEKKKKFQMKLKCILNVIPLVCMKKYL